MTILPFTIPAGIAPGRSSGRPPRLLPPPPGPPAPISLYVQHPAGIAGPAAPWLRNRNVHFTPVCLPGGRGRALFLTVMVALNARRPAGAGANAVYAGPGMQARQGSKGAGAVAAPAMLLFSQPQAIINI